MLLWRPRAHFGSSNDKLRESRFRDMLDFLSTGVAVSVTFSNSGKKRSLYCSNPSRTRQEPDS
jgi:hypothetical protein